MMRTIKQIQASIEYHTYLMGLYNGLMYAVAVFALTSAAWGKSYILAVAGLAILLYAAYCTYIGLKEIKERM